VGKRQKGSPDDQERGEHEHKVDELGALLPDLA
jgi:hypothetical protein